MYKIFKQNLTHGLTLSEHSRITHWACSDITTQVLLHHASIHTYTYTYTTTLLNWTYKCSKLTSVQRFCSYLSGAWLEQEGYSYQVVACMMSLLVDSCSLSLSASLSVGGVSFSCWRTSRFGTVSSSLTAIIFCTWSWCRRMIWPFSSLYFSLLLFYLLGFRLGQWLLKLPLESITVLIVENF